MGKNYQFKQAVKIGRHAFPLGVRQVPAEIEKHPHFQLFLKAGSVKVAGAADVDKKLSDLKPLPIASSTAAARSRQQAAVVREQGDQAPEDKGAQLPSSEPSSEAPAKAPESLDELSPLKQAGIPAEAEAGVSPDAEIGGDGESEEHEVEVEESSDEEAPAKPAHHQKKKGKGK